MTVDEVEIPQHLKTNLVLAAIAFVVLISAVYGSYRFAKTRSGEIVLPAGLNYLGPTQAPAAQTPTSTSPLTKISVPADSPLTQYQGKVYPYRFMHPTALSLGFYPNDPLDTVTIFWGDTKPEENLLVRVEDLTKIPNLAKYAKSQSKKLYASEWWQQYSFWKGLASITEFKTATGLTAYRAKYYDPSGQAPYDHVFIEVPNRSNLVVWLSGKLLPQEIFDKLVDSFSWGK